MIYTVFMAFASVYGIVFSRQIAEDKRSRTAYCFITGLMLFLIAGLRSTAVGGDSGQYARLYALVSRLELSDILERFNTEPLFYVFAKFLSIFSTSYTFLFCVIGAIFAFSISYFIYRFSEAPYISLVMLIPMQFFPFTLSGCRQALTLSIVLLAISLVLKKSYIKFAIVLLVAYFIHNSTIFVLPFILLVHLRNKTVSRILFVAGMIFTYIFRVPILSFITNYIYTDYEIYEETRGSFTTLLMYLGILILCAFFINNPRLFRTTDSELIHRSLDRLLPTDDAFVQERTMYQLFEVLLGFGVIIQLLVPLQPNIYRVAMYYQIVSILIVPKIVYSIPNRLIKGLSISGFFAIMILLYFRFTFYAAGANPYEFFWQ